MAAFSAFALFTLERLRGVLMALSMIVLVKMAFLAIANLASPGLRSPVLGEPREHGQVRAQIVASGAGEAHDILRGPAFGADLRERP